MIGCKCEAGIERELDAAETPDGRPGVSALLFAPDAEGLAKRLVERVGQTVLTCPTTACFNGLAADDEVDVGGKLRYFGDGWQASKVLAGRRYWRIPVMEGEFLVEERFGIVEGVGGGNLIILAEDAATRPARGGGGRRRDAARWRARSCRSRAASRAAAARSGRATRAQIASTNHVLCPTLRAQVDDSDVPGRRRIGARDRDRRARARSRARGDAASGSTRRRGRARCAVTAGNYGGNLGQHHFHLRELVP